LGAIVLEAGNIDSLQLGDLRSAVILSEDAGSIVLQVNDSYIAEASGSGFAFDSQGLPVGGMVSSFALRIMPEGLAQAPLQQFTATFAGAPIPLTTIADWIFRGANAEALNAVLQGDDTVYGSDVGSDLIRGYGGSDLIWGEGGADSIFGGQGDDTINAGFDPANASLIAPIGGGYLRGEDGDDVINGGPGFDDINGNQGNDTCHGGAGDDWVVGGKGNDVLFGDDGNDIVLGNIGDDTLDGGNGDDQLRGGQGDDSLSGGAGNDYISGDRGNDTESGGPGADVFHSFSGAGIDRVLDFNAAEGDRVMLDPGTSYTVSQVGQDTVVDMGGGDQVILVGVYLASLPDGWIFEG
jgi:Ca2+-binding RTX toxin-like protein